VITSENRDLKEVSKTEQAES